MARFTSSLLSRPVLALVYLWLMCVHPPAVEATRGARPTARKIRCSVVIAGGGTAATQVMELARYFPRLRFCVIERGQRIRDLPNPEMIRDINQLTLAAAGTDGVIEYLPSLVQWGLITINPDGSIVPGRVDITGIGHVFGGASAVNAATFFTPACAVLANNPPGLRCPEWKRDFDYVRQQVGTTWLPQNGTTQLREATQQAFVAAGYPLNFNKTISGNVLGSGPLLYLVTKTSSPRNRTGPLFTYGEDYSGRTVYRNVHIFSNYTADWGKFLGRRNVAQGVWATHSSGARTYFETSLHLVVLAMGTFGNVRFLKNSGIYDGDVLTAWNRPVRVDNKYVGDQLWTHGDLKQLWMPNPYITVPPVTDLEMGTSMFAHGPVPANGSLSGANQWTFGIAQLTAPIDPNLPPTIGLMEIQVYDLKSRGRVTFASPDVDAPPLIDYGWFTHPDDIQVALAAVQEAERVTNTPLFRAAYPFRYAPFNTDLSNATVAEGYIRGAINDAYHTGGTCLADVAGKPRVVDEHFRVVGTVGLYVCDTSVLKQLRINMAASAMAAGRKLVRELAESHSRGRRRPRDASAVQTDDDDDEDWLQDELDSFTSADDNGVEALPERYYNDAL